ncbi:MAG: hypothetical protein U9R57_04665 [Thermodesulfobacteriota bacterium]|nr:hypothetical protein [Thermodesulfobacteriota bacterium]
MNHCKSGYKKVHLWALAALLFFCLGNEASAEEANSWQHELTIYGWLAGIDGTVHVPTAPGSGADFNVPVEDILENLEMIFMGGWVSKKGKWSIIGDMVYMDVGDSADVVDVELDITSWVLNGGVGYDLVQTDGGILAVVGGVRYMSVEPKIQVRGVTKSQSGNLVDGIIGLRGTINFNKNWFLPYYADIGTGGSDYSYQLFAGVGYRFGWGDIRLGYRHLDFEMDDDDGPMGSMTLSGPVFGVGFIF